MDGKACQCISLGRVRQDPTRKKNSFIERWKVIDMEVGLCKSFVDENNVSQKEQKMVQ